MREFAIGLRAVLDRVYLAGGVIAAIGVSGPAERLRPGRFKALGAEVVAAADAVERALAGGDETAAASFDPCAIGSGGASLSPAPGRSTPHPQQEEKRRASE